MSLKVLAIISAFSGEVILTISVKCSDSPFKAPELKVLEIFPISTSKAVSFWVALA